MELRDQAERDQTAFPPPNTGNRVLNFHHLHHQLHYHPTQMNPFPNTRKPISETNPNSNPDPASTAPTSSTFTRPTNQISSPQISVRYRECLKNHAASIGGHVLDGCGEFMPGGEEGTQAALKCAACECHRNFHRREVDGEQSNYNVSSQNFLHHRQFSLMGGQVMVAFGGGGGGGTAAESSSEDLNTVQATSYPQAKSPKKRFRTKFSQEQKEKMMGFAEKLGWKIQKHDEREIQQFCDEVGVKRQVFRVWMHNNKQAMKKNQV